MEGKVVIDATSAESLAGGGAQVVGRSGHEWDCGKCMYLFNGPETPTCKMCDGPRLNAKTTEHAVPSAEAVLASIAPGAPSATERQMVGDTVRTSALTVDGQTFVLGELDRAKTTSEVKQLVSEKEGLGIDR
jgi:hypothetical protein